MEWIGIPMIFAQIYWSEKIGNFVKFNLCNRLLFKYFCLQPFFPKDSVSTI